MEKEVDQHVAAGKFQTAEVDGKPLSVERDYKEQPLLSKEVRLAQADLLVGEPSRREYRALIQENEYVADAYEGLGLMALRDKQNDEARRDFLESTNAGTPSARSYIEYARLEPDNGKALAALDKALKLNPKLAEGYTLIGRRQTDDVKKIQYLEKAAQLAPREAARWEELAKACLDEKAFDKAAQAWRNAEQAATTPEERERYSAARVAIDQQRLDWEEAERKREAEEHERETLKLKAQALAELRAGGSQSQCRPRDPRPEKVEKWWEGPKPDGHTAGNLTRVDCVGRQLRLVIESGRSQAHAACWFVILPISRSSAAVIRNSPVAHRSHGDHCRVLRQAQRATCDRGRSGHHPVPVMETARSRRWLVLGVFFLSSSINYLDRQSLATVAPLFRAEFHLNNADYGWILAAFSLTYAAAAPVAGY